MTFLGRLKSWFFPKPPPKSLSGLIAWLETKNPEEHYDSGHAGICLFGQFYTHLNQPYIVTLYDIAKDMKLPKETIHAIALGDYHNDVETFGAALQRARKV